MIFTLEALAAKHGDCLLLHFGDASQPSLMVIDGGPRGVYTHALAPRLQQLKGRRRTLPIALMMVSHIDDDHIQGLVDLLKQMQDRSQAGEANPPYEIKRLWHNSFESLLRTTSAEVAEELPAAAAAASGVMPVMPAGIDASPFLGAVTASVKQGIDLRNYAKQLGITLNERWEEKLVMAPSDGTLPKVVLAGGLTLTVLGPERTEMERLEKEWRKAKQERPADNAAIAADYLNRTAENLSSIVLLAEAAVDGDTRRRMLLTGDAGGDLIMRTLERSGLLTADTPFHVDLLKVQHHGSQHSVDEVFFRRVTADHYVFSGNGRHGNPHPSVLQWLTDARADAPYHAYFTYREGDDGLTEALDTFLAKEARSGRPHTYHFRSADALSIAVALGT